MNKGKISKNSEIAKTERNHSNFWVKTIIFLIISTILASTFFVKDKLENFINFAYSENHLSTTIDENGLKIHFIDVGQGDSTLIETPTGEKILIDCGDTTPSSHEKFVNYLNGIDFQIEDGEKVIDYLILTQPDSDHIGGASYILDNFKVEVCYRPNIYSLDEEVQNVELEVQCNNELYAEIVSKAKEEENCVMYSTIQEALPIRSMDYNEENSENNPLSWILEFYAPIVSELPYNTNNNYLEPITNDYSPIIILSYLDKKIMFTGDASDSVEKDFIDYYDDEEYSYIDFDIDVLKLGHHGSRYSTCEELLNFVTPEYAIASAGANNQYDHPSTYTIERLQTYGIETNYIYRTDLNGTITIGISQNGTLSLTADNLQYVNFYLEWWMMYLALELIIAIIIYFSYIKLILKKIKKSNKKLKEIKNGK